MQLSFYRERKKVEEKKVGQRPLDLSLPEGVSPVHVLPDPERVERRHRLSDPKGVAARSPGAPNPVKVVDPIVVGY